MPRTPVLINFIKLEKAAVAAFFMLSSLLHAFGILFFAASWLAYDHYRPWVNFHSEALALASVGLLLAGQCINLKTVSAQAPRVAFWVLATALLPWLQYFAGISFFAGDALVTSLFLCGLSASIWVGYRYTVDSLDPVKMLRPLFYTVWLVAIASAAIGLLQWLDLTDVFTVYVLQADTGDSNRAMGNLGQPNQLATLLLMGMVSLVWTFEQRRVGTLGLGVGIFFMTLVLVLTQSRAGMVSAVAIAIYLSCKNWGGPSKLAPRYILAWLLAFCIAVSFLPAIHDFMLMSSGRSGVRFSDGARVTIWKQVLSGIAQSPWIGYGWNQTPTAHSAGSTFVPGSLTFTYSHNIILDIVAWNGIPLGLFLTSACVWWFVSRMRRCKGPNAVYAMTCLLPIAVHSLVEFPFAYAYFLVATGLMVGIVEGSDWDIKTIPLKVRWVSVGLSIWFVLGAYMVYEYFLIEEDFRVVRFENMRVGKTPADYEVPHVWMLSHLASMLKAGRQEATPGMSREGIENLRKASLRFPYSVLGVRYALALGLNGDPVGASHQMAIIRGMFGDYYYKAAVGVLRDQQRDKYPELVKVLTP